MRALLVSVLAVGSLALIACDPAPPGGGTTPDPEPATCAEVEADMAAELDSIQSCTTDEQCGQVLSGTSCGCTRNLVARNDADTTAFYDLQELQLELQCGGLISTCDCPPADGFACDDGTCSWNYSTPF